MVSTYNNNPPTKTLLDKPTEPITIQMTPSTNKKNGKRRRMQSDNTHDGDLNASRYNEWTLDLSLLCKAAARDDRKTIYSSLIGGNNPSIFESTTTSNKCSSSSSKHVYSAPLLPSTEISNALNRLLVHLLEKKDVSSLSTDTNQYFSNIESVTKNMDLLLRSLLLLPSFSVTPWEAIHHTISSIYKYAQVDMTTLSSNDGNSTVVSSTKAMETLTYLSEIQVFLNSVGGYSMQQQQQQRSNINIIQTDNMNEKERTRIRNNTLQTQTFVSQCNELYSTFQLVVYPLLHGHDTTHADCNVLIRNQDYFQTMPYNIILSSILSAARRLDEDGLIYFPTKHQNDDEINIYNNTSKFMNTLYPTPSSKNDIHPSMILFLLQTSNKLSTFLSETNECNLIKVIYKSISKIPALLLPEVVKEIFTFLSSSCPSQNVNTFDWINIIFHIYYCSSSSQQLHSVTAKIETSLFYSFSHSSIEVMSNFIKCCVDRNYIQQKLCNFKSDLPDWVYINLLLLLYCSVRDDGTTFCIPNGRFQKSDTSSFVSQIISGLTQSEKCLYSKYTPNGDDDNNIDIECFKSNLIGMIYMGKGKIKADVQNESADCIPRLISFYSRRIYDSIFTDKVKNDDSLIDQRGKRWLDMATFIISDSVNMNNKRIDSMYQFCLIAAIINVVFWDLSSLRNDILQFLNQNICKNLDSKAFHIDPRLFICWVVYMLGQTLSFHIHTKSSHEEDMNKLDIIIASKNELSSLCTLLSSPTCITELPNQVFDEYMMSLSSFEDGRNAIFHFSEMQLTLHSNRNVMWDTAYSFRPMKCALSGYLYLLQDRSMSKEEGLDDASLHSLIKVSDILILNQPWVHDNLRLYLMEKIFHMMEMKSFSSWVTERIVNAGIFSLLDCFCYSVSESQQNPIISCTKQYDVTIKSNELIFNPVAISSNRKMSELPFIFRILIASLAVTDTSFNTHKEKIENIIIRTFDTTEDVQSNIINSVNSSIDDESNAFSVVISILRYLMEMRTSFLGASSNLQKCSDLHQNIIRHERNSWECYNCEQHNLAPLWLGSSCHTLKTSVLDQSILSSSLIKLCDTLLSFLLEFCQSASEKYEDSCDSHFTLTYGSYVLLAIRKEMNNPQANILSTSKHYAYSFCCEMSLHEISTLFEATKKSLFLLRTNNIKSTCVNFMEYVNLLLCAVRDACEHLHNILGSGLDSTMKTKRFLAQSLWNLYSAICDDSIRSHITTLLTQQSSNKDMLPKPRLHSFSEVQYIEDIDASWIRLKTRLLTCCQVVIPYMFNTSTRSDREIHSQPEDTWTFTFGCQVLCALCHDLHFYLNRPGDDEVPSLHKLYVVSIEETAKILHGMNDDCILALLQNHQGVQCLVDIVNMCTITSAILFDTLCRSDLNNNRLFKSSFQVLMSYVPQLIRRVEYLFLTHSNVIDDEASNVFALGDQSTILKTILIQCARMSIAKGRHTKKKKSDVWIQVYYNNSGTNDASNRYKSFNIAETSQPNMNENDYFKITHIIDRQGLSIPRSELSQITIRNEKLWDWVCSTTELETERVWMDSYRIVSGSDSKQSRKTLDIKLKWNQKMSFYSKRRFDLLRSTLSSIYLLFSPLELNKSTRGRKRSFDKNSSDADFTIAAEYLSSDGQRRLCSCVERIVSTLICSFNNLYRFVKSKKNKYHSLHQMKLPHHIFLVITEAVICLLSWFDKEERNPIPIDITVGTRIWFNISQKNGKTKTESSLQNRLIKVLERIDLLDKITRTFRESLLEKVENMKHICEDEESCHSKVGFLDDLVHEMQSQYNDDSNKTQEGQKAASIDFDQKLSFLDILDRHVQSIRHSKTDHEQYDSLFEGDTQQPICSSHEKNHLDDDSKVSSTSNRKKSKSIITEARRSKVRSQNKVVDEWLELDCDWVGKDEGGMNDSYADLDDFIVEG